MADGGETSKQDSRNLPVEVLNERRRRAVKLRLAGMKLTDVAAQSELSVPTVIAAHRAYVEGGWDAVGVKPRGRRAGEGRVLSAAQETEILNAMCAGEPDAQGLNHRLWQETALADLVRQRFGVELPARTLSRYLERWKLSFARPDQEAGEGNNAADRDTAERRRWLKSTWPGLADKARSQRATVVWAGQVGWALPGRDGSRHSVMYALTNRGRSNWLILRDHPNARNLIDFFERVLAAVPRKAYVILDGLQIDRVPSLQTWLADQAERIELFQIPTGSGTSAMPVLPASSVGSKGLDKPEPVNQPKAQSKTQSRTQSKTQPKTKSVIREAVATRDNYDGEPKEMTLTHLQRLEAESIHIMREVVAEADNPVMLYSIGKDSAVMLHLAMKAFYPAKPPFPLLHVDTTWKFREMIAFRDQMADKLGLKLLVHINQEGLEMGINPFTHGSAIHTDIMKTQGLKQALDKYGFDAAFGGARRDEEKSRAKERIFSFRSAQHRWDPKSQRPELWKLYNARKHKGESIRVFPLSNWTELDIWQYIYLQNIPIVPLYFSAERPVVERDGTLIMVDDDRMPLKDGEVPMMRKVRFRTLGCYPLTGAVESEADTLPAIIQEMLLTTTSERQGRVIDHDSAASMEKKKQEGYF